MIQNTLKGWVRVTKEDRKKRKRKVKNRVDNNEGRTENQTETAAILCVKWQEKKLWLRRGADV
jgi:hypothetical protein